MDRGDLAGDLGVGDVGQPGGEPGVGRRDFVGLRAPACGIGLEQAAEPGTSFFVAKSFGLAHGLVQALQRRVAPRPGGAADSFVGSTSTAIDFSMAGVAVRRIAIRSLISATCSLASASFPFRLSDFFGSPAASASCFSRSATFVSALARSASAVARWVRGLAGTASSSSGSRDIEGCPTGIALAADHLPLRNRRRITAPGSWRAWRVDFRSENGESWETGGRGSQRRCREAPDPR